MFSSTTTNWHPNHEHHFRDELSTYSQVIDDRKRVNITAESAIETVSQALRLMMMDLERSQRAHVLKIRITYIMIITLMSWGKRRNQPSAMLIPNTPTTENTDLALEKWIEDSDKTYQQQLYKARDKSQRSGTFQFPLHFPRCRSQSPTWMKIINTHVR